MLVMKRTLGVSLAVSLLACNAFAGGGERVTAPTCANSMRPINVAGIDIKNFGVVDGHIYRGNQPSKSDYQCLKALGVSTIVDLRDDAKSSARRDAEAAGLKYVNIPMDDRDKPYDTQVATFLAAVTDPANGNCYVHCVGGRHRTGATIAIYRIAVEGWTADAAFAEMESYDFYSRWGHKAYKSYVYDYYARMKADPSSVPLAYVPGRAPAVRTPQ